MLKRVTVRLRVIVAVATLLLTTAGVGLFSLDLLHKVDATANLVATNWLPATAALGRVAEDFERARSLQASALLQTPDMRDRTLSQAKAARAEIDGEFKRYDPTIFPGEEAGLAAKMKASLKTYDDLSADFEQRLAQGDTTGAGQLFVGDMQTATDAARKAIQDDCQFQVRGGGKSVAEGEKLGKDGKILIMSAIGIAALIGIVIGWLMITGVSSPIRKMAEVMRQLSSGDVRITIPNLGEKNEIGEMAGAVEVFKDGMIRNNALETEAVKAREDNEIQRKKTMRELADGFESAVGGIVEMVSSAATEMQATASQLTSSAHESAAQATSVSAAAEEAGTNVTSVAGSAEELGASVNEIARQVQHSLHKAREAVTEADATAAIVNELSEAAGRINGIVDMIAGIASQTNLLALNATIESARAGEAGKGFAVVASEVKQLAGQTAKATSDISGQIASIQSTTKRAVDAIVNITATIRDINDSSTTIAAAVDQQGAATNEIVQAVNQASMGTSEVTANITGVARMAEETGAGAHQVLTASSELAKQAEHLRGQVQNFIAQVRAA